MTTAYPHIYKKDSKGKLRVWFMEQDGDRYRTFDGVLDGTVKASAWKSAKPTNVGRSNERNGEAQAQFEIEARYEKQLKTEYHRTIEDTDKGAHYDQPMLAKSYEKFAVGDAQPKLDGFRCIITADGGFSREGERLPGADHIVRAVRERGVFDKAPGIKLDGELYNHQLADDFGKLSSLIKKGTPTLEERATIEALVQFHCYDILSMDAPWTARSKAVAALVAALDLECVKAVETIPVDTVEAYDAAHGVWVEAGYEGSMWRSRDAGYEGGRRSAGLRKRKDFDDAEFDLIPGGIEEGEGNWAGAAKRAVFWLPNADRSIDLSDKDARLANTFEAGLRGTYSANATLLAEAAEQKVATVRYFGFTTTDVPKPRFGVVTKWHGAGRTL